MKKIILDTDIGSDIDDAVCLAYLLARRDCALMGITTVSGEAVKRAELASAICRAARRDIPIYPGIERPLIVEPRQPFALQHKNIGGWDYARDFPRNEAVAFLQRTIRENPGEITLLTIGPLTNVAALFAIDPEIPGLLKELVLMCGAFADAPGVLPPDFVEWNAKCDPHAARIVYDAPVRVHRSVGIDVTHKAAMGRDEVLTRFQAGILKPVVDFAGVWFDDLHRDKLVFHDPLAAATIFDGGVCGFTRGNVSVELSPEELCGLTRWEPDAQSGRHEVAVSVDVGRFMEHYFETVNGV